MNQNDSGRIWHLGYADAHGAGARLAAGDARNNLACALLLRTEDRRLLPTGRSDDNQLVDMLAGVESRETLGQQWPSVERDERLRAIGGQPFTAARRDQNCPRLAHRSARDATRAAINSRPALSILS